jgi:hypothetical protein
MVEAARIVERIRRSILFDLSGHACRCLRASKPRPSTPPLRNSTEHEVDHTNVQVELHDPVLPHANFERPMGSVAEKCDTPKEAPRVSRRAHPASRVSPHRTLAY